MHVTRESSAAVCPVLLGLLLSIMSAVGADVAIASDVTAESAKRSPNFSGPIVEAPSRDFDFRHLRLECEFDWPTKSVTGRVVHTVSSLRDGARRLRLHGINIDVRSVRRVGRGPLSFESFADSIEIDLGRETSVGVELQVAIEYVAHPKRGVFFWMPSHDYPDVPMQLWTQGETEDARHWIPCFDHPSDKLTTEVIVTAPAALQVLANGRRIEERIVGDDRKIVHWLQDKPHTTYLISVVMGTFARWDGDADGVPMSTYVAPRYAERAERSFGLTADMMRFFHRKIGYRYPWDRYDQVCVYGFPFGGMENTAQTTLTERTLHDERAALDVSSMNLVAHELIHQWFGNLVTCKDWGDIWLNESFATFFANLYREHRLGRDEGLLDRHGLATSYFSEDRNEYRRPLATRRYLKPGHVFDSHAYPKGGVILSMLRYVLGDERFFAGMRYYLERHQFRSVETADFRIAMEEATGQSLRWFFDQWVHAGGHPEYKITTEWQSDEPVLQLRVQQTQTVDDLTPLHDMPVVIAVTTPAGMIEHRVRVSKSDETFSFPVAQRPTMVRFDPGNWILKTLSFAKSREELLYQLEHDPDMMGRHRAAVDLKGFLQQESAVATLIERLQKEPFWGVRKAIAETLSRGRGKAVSTALRAVFDIEPHARVRRQIVEALGALKDADAVPLLRKAMSEDRSYYVAAAALRALATVSPDEARSVAQKVFTRESHQDVIAVAAIEVFGAQVKGEKKMAREERLAILLPLSAPGNSRAVREAAIKALGSLGEGNKSVYTGLTSALEDELIYIRLAAVRALGELGDRRAIEPLTELRARDDEVMFRNPRQAIDQALAAIRAAGKPAELQTQIDELRRKNEELETRLKTIEERKS